MPAQANAQKAHEIAEVKMNFFMAKASTWAKNLGQQLILTNPIQDVVKVITSGFASDLGKKNGGIGLQTAMPPIQLT